MSYEEEDTCHMIIYQVQTFPKPLDELSTGLV
jgi:hypothetical protein